MSSYHYAPTAAPVRSTRDQYKSIANGYKQMAEQASPLQRLAEIYPFRQLAGDLRGKSVLDFACGSGRYTRMVKEWGASHVMGVDLSPEMIALARASERRHPQGIEYIEADGFTYRPSEQFDVVTAAFFFNYARSADELSQMLASVLGALKPGGRLLALNHRFSQQPSSFPRMRRYGMSKRLLGPEAEGTPVEISFETPSGPISICNYYLPHAIMERTILQAGFTNLRWTLPFIPPEASRGERSYLRDCLCDPWFHFFEARRPK